MARSWCDDRRPTALIYTSTEMIRSCRTQVLIAFTSCTVLFLLLTHASYRERSHSSLVRFQSMASRVAASLRNETGESSVDACLHRVHIGLKIAYHYNSHYLSLQTHRDSLSRRSDDTHIATHVLYTHRVHGIGMYFRPVA